MTDDFERNLDSLARCLAAIDEAMDDALSDEPRPQQLPVAERPLTYPEITAFNDQLRDRFGWTEVDLDAALTDEQRDELHAWRERHRRSWTTGDFAAVGVAGLIGALCVWFDTAVDRSTGTRLRRLTETERVRGWERAGKRLPIDYMGPGFGGRAHRVKSGGHDLLRTFTTLRQIMDGQFQGVRYENGRRIDERVDNRFEQVEDWPDAGLRLMRHLAADFLTPMSLPIPGMSLLYESGNETARQFALHAYSGMRAGEGWNLRSATVAPTFSTVVTELVVRTHVCAESIRESNTFALLTLPWQRKQNELLLAAHALVAASAAGKTTARLLAVRSRRGVLHPATIRHLQLPALIRAGWAAVDVIIDTRSATGHSASEWDDLALRVPKLPLA
ncbi:hypothetical protein ACFYTQ_12850 [Nocardia sp. NPDC004068]|uniref:hypothetical protein n=1 Tax=Nocardia sp. NPDC004068 TaxID=3364303 RepID=UPI0036B9F4C3